jgi:hypothetical protein
MMTKIFFFLFLIISLPIFSQVGIGTDKPDPSAELEIYSKSKGFLIPRMDTDARDTINNGVITPGLVIYNTDDDCLNFYNGADWVNPCDLTGGIPPALPQNITLTAGQKLYIASVYDEDYLPYTPPQNVADIGSFDADSMPETLVDFQGVLTTTGLKVFIPYVVVNDSVKLPAFSQTKRVKSKYIQGANTNSNEGGGASVNVEFSYEAHHLAVGSGYIEATIKALNTDLNAVKLDINLGLGTDLGILLAEFLIATDASGNTGVIQLKDIPGIPDRRFGIATTQGMAAGQYHLNLYKPISTAEGKIWLNHNLGANYTDVTETAVFDLGATTSGQNDFNAYGNYFQWGRFSDGHELFDVTASSFTTSSALNSVENTASNSNTPGHNRYIIDVISGQSDWRVSTAYDLWIVPNNENNPCPFGFRVPTFDELNEMLSAEGITNNFNAYQNKMGIPSAGQRTNATNIVNNTVWYWTSTSAIGRVSTSLQIDVVGVHASTTQPRSRAMPIRCVSE